MTSWSILDNDSLTEIPKYLHKKSFSIQSLTQKFCQLRKKYSKKNGLKLIIQAYCTYDPKYSPFYPIYLSYPIENQTFPNFFLLKAPNKKDLRRNHICSDPTTYPNHACGAREILPVSCHI